MSLIDNINQGVDDLGLLHQIIHGDSSQTVTTNGGPVPTVANAISSVLGKVIASLSATSTTSQPIDSNDKVFSIAAGKAFQPGQSVIVSANASNYISAVVISYVSSNLTIRPVSLNGSGTFDSWNIVFSGIAGKQGVAGNDGVDGKSAYQIAIEQGYQGTLQDWLDALKGKDGTSIIIKGTLTDQSALPSNAQVGDAYVINGDIWVNGQSAWFNAGQFLGLTGDAGRSAYQIALDNGFVGDEATWLTSLKGAPGNQGADGANGVDGKSAYELAIQAGFNGTVAAWLNSLVGAKGDTGNDGANGKSAYQIAVDDGFPGSEQDWLTSLQGPKGDQGIQGVPGLDGVNGSNGTDGANGVDGKTVRYGSGAPTAGLGTDGDFYIDVSANFIYGPKAAGDWPAGVSVIGPKGDQGAKGDTGTAGNNGSDGKTVNYGSGAPVTGLGAAGDFYIDTAANVIYGPKTTVWPAGVSLIGPAGPKGDPGNTGSAGADGKTVRYGSGAPDDSLGVDGDFYIDTVTHSIYGPKATTWPAGTSLVGPPGQKGDPGSQGTPGIVPALTVVASEALSAGDFVNLYSNSGVLNARRASAALGYRAHGFVLAAVTNGGNASVNTIGVNTAVTGQTIGDVFLQPTAGQAGVTPPSGSGQIVQNLGTALSATSINFESKLVITLA